MTPHPPANNTLHEIEQRQDQVLAELEVLEQQLIQLLAQFSPASPATATQPLAAVDTRAQRAA